MIGVYNMNVLRIINGEVCLCEIIYARLSNLVGWYIIVVMGVSYVPDHPFGEEKLEPMRWSFELI